MPRRDHDWFWHVGAEFSGIVAESLAVPASVASSKYWQPRVDVLEDRWVFLIRAELAGVHLEDIHLSYQPDQHAILLRGARHEENPPEMKRIAIHQLEVLYGEFEREIPLPKHVKIDPNRIQATFREGFLAILVPKANQEA